MIDFITRRLEHYFITLFILTVVLFWAHVRLWDITVDHVLPEYLAYAGRMITFDFGFSSESGAPILREMETFFPPTLELMGLSLILSAAAGVLLGTVGGLNHRSRADNCIYVFCLIGNSVPSYWLAQILILLFCITFRAFPTSGNISLTYDVPSVTGFMTVDAFLTGDREIVRDMLDHLALPLLTLSVVPCASFASIARKATISLAQKYFIKAALCRGESKLDIGFNHVLRNIFSAVVEKLNSIICNLFSSCVLVEVVFEWSGTGLWITQSIANSDYNILEAATFVIGAGFMTLNVTLNLLSSLLISRRPYQEN